MYKIAIVDDEPLMLEGFSKSLDWRAEGYDLIGTFRNSYDFLEFCRSQIPDIALIDINMPQINGLELLKELKIHHPEIHVIMLTAHNDFTYVRDSLRYHADEYLWKPEIEFKDILECMNRVISSQNIIKKNDSDKDIDEFLDYLTEKNCFDSNAFNNLIRDVEKTLNMGVYCNLNQVKTNVNLLLQMIFEKKPKKAEIISGIMHLNYIYQSLLLPSDHLKTCNDEKLINLFHSKTTFPYTVEKLKEIFDEWHRLLIAQAQEENEKLSRQIKSYILMNIQNEQLNLMDISKAVNLSYSYLSRIFPDIMGQNFSKYLIRIRLNKACEYLKNSKFTIDQIIELIGYNNKSYFIKSFKQYTGMTPAKYRQCQDII